MYFQLWCYAVVLTLAHISQANDDNIEDPYLESLGCIRVYDSDGKRFEKYNCSMIKKLDKDQCFFLGGYYYPNEYEKKGEKHCMFNCKCSPVHGSMQCAEVDCPSFSEKLKKGCFQVGEGCCPDETVCESDKHPFTCTYDGETYLPGMKFYPKACTTCTCEEGFTGELVAPFCKKDVCVSNDKYYDALINKCAPVYKRCSCCPVIFACDSEDVTIESTGSGECKDLDCCLFGNKTFNIGAKITVERPVKSACTCLIPPSLTCITEVEYADLL